MSQNTTLSCIGKVCLVPLICLMCSLSAAASEELLRDFFVNVNSLSANFVQRVEDESGSPLEVSAGKLYLSRPGKFRWDYQNLDFEGEPGLQIVADGESLYFYDPDLEQVSRRSLDDAVDQVPSLLLVQSGAELDLHFTVTDFGMADGLSWVNLTPKSEDAGYRELMVGFAEERINTLLLYDGLGNSTRLELMAVESNIDLVSSVFEFTVPPGADLLSE